MRKHGCPVSTPFSEYPESHHFLCSVNSLDIIAVLWADTIRVRASQLGFTIEDVGTHSLCSGGAMAMHIVGVPDRTLVSIGRWRSLVFMVYIKQ